MSQERDSAGRFAPGNQIGKGNKGGPGRPKGGRALTEILRRCGNRRMVVKGEDRKRGRKFVLADLLWQAVTMGLVQFPDGGILKLDGKAWVECVRWLYRHIDGDAPQHIQMEDISRYEAAAAAVRDAIVNGNAEGAGTSSGNDSTDS